MSTNEPVVIGLDLGTGGARALALTLDGRLASVGRSAFPPGSTRQVGPVVEQDPLAWTDAARAALAMLIRELSPGTEILGISVDATSGTFLLADAHHRPLTPGIMYNDLRARDQADPAAEALRGVLGKYGVEIAASFALPKILHLAHTDPNTFAECRHVVHQTDWVVGMLTGCYDVTDISTALKTGADPGRLEWPAAIENRLGLARDLLPRIVMPGTHIADVTPQAAAATGLPAGTPVISGCTDGTAGFLASGARRSGDLNVTLGTTLVFKAVSTDPLVDPQGVIYNHRHPAGGYLPGAASSTGAAWVEAGFAKMDLDALGREAVTLVPTRHAVYPLTTQGERFPFACPQATGFGLNDIASPAERFAAGMEAVALLEWMGIDRFESLGLPINATVYATGGATAADTWLRIRAAINRRIYAVPAQAECAAGAAILAAVPTLGGCGEAIRRLVRIERQIEPEPQLVAAYKGRAERFKATLRERGYL